MKVQAERCSDEHVELHIARQRALGAKMAGESDQPRRIEVLVVAAVVMLALVIAAHRGWV